MELKEFLEIFGNLSNANGIDKISDEAQRKLYGLSGCLSEANKIHNLTAIKEEKEIILKHFVDSLMISEHVPEGARVIDIGCGAGFPSLPLSIARPDLSVLGVDSTTKKINYVNETAKTLSLHNLEAISARAEELGHDGDYRESFDVATARAVASLPVLCELCLPFVRVGGKFVAMKAQNPEEEIAASLGAISKCGGEFYKTVYKELRSDTGETEKRCLIIIKKVKETPGLYPRSYSKIAKKPL